MRLKVVTMVDQRTDRMSTLQESCERYGLDLVVLHRNPWINNAFKLRLLANYLNDPSLDEGDLVMVVDAYDVIITRKSDHLISRFKEMESDIVFSAEANYYFREPNLTLYYWMFYPRNPSSIFHFLNSGSFMGSVRSLRSLLRTVSTFYTIDFTNDQQLTQIRSDQYVYSRFYVDYMTGSIEADFTLKVDSKQELFGCSGGRMSVINWPSVHWIQDYLFFKYERRWLKTFWMKGGQTNIRDFSIDEKADTYTNSKTESAPPVLHLPGTHTFFKKALKRISGTPMWDKWILLSPLTILVSSIAFIRSMVNFLYIKLRNKGAVDFASIFPVLAGGDHSKPPEPPATGLVRLSVNDRLSPYFISLVREKKVYFLVRRTSSFDSFQKLGIEVDMDRVFTTENENKLEGVLTPGAILVDAIGTFALRPEILSKYLVYYPTESLAHILFTGKLKGAFPSDNPFTIHN